MAVVISIVVGKATCPDGCGIDGGVARWSVKTAVPVQLVAVVIWRLTRVGRVQLA